MTSAELGSNYVNKTCRTKPWRHNIDLVEIYMKIERKVRKLGCPYLPNGSFDFDQKQFPKRSIKRGVSQPKIIYFAQREHLQIDANLSGGSTYQTKISTRAPLVTPEAGGRGPSALNRYVGNGERMSHWQRNLRPLGILRPLRIKALNLHVHV